jgi:sugar phosphate isomerase/epimerase
MKSAITLCLFPEAKGAPFVLWDSLAAGFERAAKFGFDAAELFPGSPEDLDSNEVRGLIEKHHLQVAAVGSGAGWVKHKLRLTDPDAAIRERARKFIEGMVDVAGSLGAPVILGSMQGRWEGDVTRKQAVSWLAEALEQFGARAEKLGVPFFYEFLNRYETNLFNRVAESLEFLSALRTRNVKLLCDLFHMNIEEPAIPAALRLAGSNLGHVHFADSNRHAIGFGHTPMKPVMAALSDIGYSGYLSAEVLPLPDSETAARQTLASFREFMVSPK